MTNVRKHYNKRCVMPFGFGMDLLSNEKYIAIAFVLYEYIIKMHFALSFSINASLICYCLGVKLKWNAIN